MRRVIIGLALFTFLVAADAFATCYKCRDQTCYMAEGTSEWCKGITNGCFAGGTCSGGNCGREICGPEEPVASLEEPLAAEWQLVSVTVKSEKRPTVRVARHELKKGQ